MKLDDPAERRHPFWWVLAAFGLVAVLVAGWVIIAALTRTGDTAEPGSPASEAGTGSGSGLPAFAADPVFDSYGRVAYVPKNNPHGVALTSTVSRTAGRSITQKPDGVLLEKVNDDMVLPFSTSDGPTGFTSSGVATGFSHTAQGAALAAIHYMCWLQKPGERTDRVKALVGHSIVDDDGLLQNMIKNPRTDFDLKGECTAAQLKVDYNPVLTKVRLGYRFIYKNGTATNFMNVVIVEWRDGGWILKLHAYNKNDEPGGYFGPSLTFDPAQGWVSWFQS